MLCELPRLLFYLLAILRNVLRNIYQNFAPRSSVVCSYRWEIGSSKKRPLIGQYKHVQWPSARTRHGLHGIHVHMVYIGVFLAVDLDANKQLIHQGGRFGQGKTLVFHNVAPMARRIADTHQYGFVFSLGASKGLLAPGVPIDGVIGMLQQVGRRFKL